MTTALRTYKAPVTTALCGVHSVIRNGMTSHLRRGRHLMSLYEILIDRWESATKPYQNGDSTTRLEAGNVLFMPSLRFEIAADESPLFTPAILGGAKNASYDPRTDTLGGTTLAGVDATRLRGLMRRFSSAAASLVSTLLPAYRGEIVQA